MGSRTGKVRDPIFSSAYKGVPHFIGCCTPFGFSCCLFSEWRDLKMLTARIEKIRQNYVNAKPQISCERAALWTESYKRSAGKPVCIRSADKSTAFRVGAAGHAGIRDKGHFL